jgi:hypothetical protein
MWLTGRLSPDHKTLADFRKDSGGAIKKVCVQFIERAVASVLRNGFWQSHSEQRAIAKDNAQRSCDPNLVLSYSPGCIARAASES